MKRLPIRDWYLQARTLPLFDVRTPKEFENGHINGALNLPLFSNDERAEVGTLYKQVSREAAFMKGLEFVGPKLGWFVQEVQKLAPEREVIVHCWRGGQRSASIAGLLEFAGFSVSVLEGGYKAYRHFVLEQFARRTSRFLVLGGKTGSGKTKILQELQNLGEQVIDLEKLAHHKGSAFGALGETQQPRPEQFENELFDEFWDLDTSKRIWVENESRSIGKLFIPQGFFDQIKSSPLIQLEVPFDERVQQLMEDYSCYPKDQLISSMMKIEKRLGGQNVKLALEKLDEGDFHTATSMALKYYDKTYLHSTSLGNFSQRHTLEMDRIEPAVMAKQLIEFADENAL